MTVSSGNLDAQAYKAVRDAINGWDPTGDAIYYWNPVTATSKWIWSRQIHTQIGKHVLLVKNVGLSPTFFVMFARLKQMPLG